MPFPLPVLLLLVVRAAAIDNGLGLKPPMGWRSWNLYGKRVDQGLLTGIMDGMVARKRHVGGVPTSLCDLGYCDVGLDDNWQACGSGSNGYNYHAADGSSNVNFNRFPDMAGMTAHAHGLGLTAGWYLNNCICMEKKGATREMYEQDANMLANFGFDGVKLDGCGKQWDLDLWAELINKTGRPIVIENCHWGQTVPTEDWCPWNFYRTTGDVRAYFPSVMSNLMQSQQFLAKNLSRPGCWAYPDMLQVGCHDGPGGVDDPGLTIIEARTHFGAWCILSSPLTLSFDINDDAVLAQVWPIISDKEAIAINHAWAGHGGSIFKESGNRFKAYWPSGGWMGELPTWVYLWKPLGSGAVAVMLINNAPDSQALYLDLAEVPELACTRCAVRDVWHRADGVVDGSLAVELLSHDSALLVLRPLGQAPDRWTCHRYIDGQSDGWCASAGVQNGLEFKLFPGGHGPCGGCSCCKKPHQGSEERKPQVEFAGAELDRVLVDDQPAEAEVADSSAAHWSCYDYQPGQDDEWCKNANVHNGMFFELFPGGHGPCGPCSCCQRPTVYLHRALVDSELAEAGPEEEASWTCHHYSAGQSDDWCAAAGVSNGIEFKLVHGDGTCGQCSCCARLRLPGPSQAAETQAKYVAQGARDPALVGKLAWHSGAAASAAGAAIVLSALLFAMARARACIPGLAAETLAASAAFEREPFFNVDALEDGSS